MLTRQWIGFCRKISNHALFLRPLHPESEHFLIEDVAMQVAVSGISASPDQQAR